MLLYRYLLCNQPQNPSLYIIPVFNFLFCTWMHCCMLLIDNGVLITVTIDMMTMVYLIFGCPIIQTYYLKVIAAIIVSKLKKWWLSFSLVKRCSRQSWFLHKWIVGLNYKHLLDIVSTSSFPVSSFVDSFILSFVIFALERLIGMFLFFMAARRYMACRRRKVTLWVCMVSHDQLWISKHCQGINNIILRLAQVFSVIEVLCSMI